MSQKKSLALKKKAFHWT